MQPLLVYNKASSASREPDGCCTQLTTHFMSTNALLGASRGSLNSHTSCRLLGSLISEGSAT